MHSSRQLRFREVANDIVDTLIGIAAEPRLMPGAAIVPSAASATRLRATTRHAADGASTAGTDMASATPVRAVRSSASTPSLRSRDGTVPPHARMDPGGNVRVVVRVRAFLPRGACLVAFPLRADRERFPAPFPPGPRATLLLTVGKQRLRRTRRA